MHIAVGPFQLMPPQTWDFGGMLGTGFQLETSSLQKEAQSSTHEADNSERTL